MQEGARGVIRRAPNRRRERRQAAAAAQRPHIQNVLLGLGQIEGLAPGGPLLRPERGRGPRHMCGPGAPSCMDGAAAARPNAWRPAEFATTAAHIPKRLYVQPAACGQVWRLRLQRQLASHGAGRGERRRRPSQKGGKADGLVLLASEPGTTAVRGERFSGSWAARTETRAGREPARLASGAA